jgi:prepilin-type N-terminal cleavage/methylation domain-containing protein
MNHVVRIKARRQAVCRLNRRPQLRRRSGVSLTELLVVISVASVLVGVAGMTIHRLLAAEQEVTRAARFSASMTRLSRSFRADLHAARSAELTAAAAGQPEALVATLDPGHVVRYEFDGHTATRLETNEGVPVRRESFPFAPQSQLRCLLNEAGTLVRLELNLSTRASGPDVAPSPRVLLLEVAVARDHRFETLQTTQGISR